MQKAAGRILKSEEVTLEGRIRLDVPHLQPNLPKGTAAASATQQARIVENHPEFAVVEITCSCGRRTYLKCEYGDSESPAEAAKVQDATLEASEKATNQTK
jgi:hypothetical protein